MADCNADTQANSLFTSLTADAPTVPTFDLTAPEFDFTVDAGSDLYTAVSSVTLAELTAGTLDGAGVFDTLMASVDLHVEREYKANRITSDEYAAVYTEIMSTVLNQATNFLLNKDRARWEAVAAQMQARVAEIRATEALISLEQTKALTQKALFDMYNSGADYALTKINIANADAQYCEIIKGTEIKTFELENLLPITKAQEQHKLNCTMPAQTQLVEEQVETARAQTLDTRSDNMTPVSGILGQQKAGLVLDVSMKQYGFDNTLPAQLNILQEQRESERAKTLDTRSDAAPVTGSIGKQKELYDEQILSFEKDAKFKTAKMYLDGWITQKTLDEGLLAPTELQNTGVDAVLASIRATNGLT